MPVSFSVLFLQVQASWFFSTTAIPDHTDITGARFGHLWGRWVSRTGIVERRCKQQNNELMCSSHCCTTQGVLNILLGLKKEVLCRQAANDCYYITPTRQAASKPLFSMLNLIFMNLGLTVSLLKFLACSGLLVLLSLTALAIFICLISYPFLFTEK